VMMVHQRLVTTHPLLPLLPTTTQPPLLLLLWSGIRGLGIPITGNNTKKDVDMKTIKTFFVSFAFLCLGLVPILAMGQSLPHTFTANTSAKASEVNANFQYLLERFGTRKTSVNCYSGESITTALQNYNHIIISGICTENLNLDATTFTHRLVILEGSSSSSDGIKASDTSNPVIKICCGAITLKVSKLKLTGGTLGIVSFVGPTIILKNVLVENNTSTGIHIRASVGAIEDSTIQNNGSHAILIDYSGAAGIGGNTISGHTSNQSIKITRGASADIFKNTITNGEHAGISVDRGSFAQIGKDPDSGVSRGNTIQSADNGISVQDSSHAILKYNTVKNNSRNGLVIENNASVILAAGNTFSNNSEYGINMYNGGSLNMWCDAQLTSPTTISGNTEGTIQVSAASKAGLCNLRLSSPKNGIQAGMGSYLNIRNITITNSQGNGISLWGAKGQIDNATITGSSNAGIRLNNGAQMEMNNSTISENSEDGVDAHGSGIRISNSTISLNKSNGVNVSQTSRVNIDNVIVSGNEKNGIQIKRNTYIQVSDSNIESNKANGISVSRNSYLDLNRSSIKNNTQDGVNVYHNSSLDFGGESSDTATVIELNGGDGVDVYKKVIVEFDGAPVTIKNNTGNQFKFGAGSESYIPASTLTVNRIDCWYRTTKDPNNNSVTHSSGYPIIGFENISAFAGTISSNCRVD